MGKSKEIAELGDVVTQDSGNVGIGTSSPSAPIEISRSDAGIIQYITNTGSNQAYTAYGNSDNPPWSQDFGTAGGLLVGIDHDETGVVYQGGNKALRFGTNATERMRIDSAGRVTMPYQPTFMVVDGNGYNDDGYLNSFSTIKHNTGGHFNNSTGQFTAPVGGTYLFTAGILVSSGQGRLEYKLNYNGSTVVNGNGTGSTFDGPTLTAFVQMNANDYVRVDRVSGTAYNNGTHSNTYFGGYLLG